MQSVAAGPAAVSSSEYSPAAQFSVQEDLVEPGCPNLPASQFMHTSLLWAPVDPEYLPLPQSWHVVSSDLPSSDDHLPAPQSVHEV